MLQLLRQTVAQKLRAGLARLGLMLMAAMLAATGAVFALIAAQTALTRSFGPIAANALLAAALFAAALICVLAAQRKPAPVLGVPAADPPAATPTPPNPAIGMAFLVGFLLARRLPRR